MTTIAASGSAAATSQPRSTSWRYIYGIVPAAETLLFETPGLGNADVYCLPYGELELAAVVSTAERTDYRRLERQEALGYLVAHQRVVEAVMEHMPVLPVKFGTVLPDEDRVQALLAQGAQQFRQALDMLQGAVQMEVLVLWDLARLFQLIGEEPEIVALKAQVATLPAEQANEMRVAVGKLVKESIDRRRVQLQKALSEPLCELAHDSIVNLLMDDSMVLNLALLVDVEGRQALEQRLDELDAIFGAGDAYLPPLQLRLVGPLPPYSFASVEVVMPQPEDITAARMLLELDETVDAGAIRAAYWHRAAHLHPDLNPDLPDAEAQMTKLAQAHHLLSAYAESRVQATEGKAQQICFDCETMERTLLIAVRRQGD